MLLAGAGGAGRAVAFAVAEAGAASLTVANRTEARADRLARDIGAAYPAVAVAAGPPDPAGHDVVINATSLGTRPGDPLPVLVDRLAPGTLVCDIVTRPEETQLLREAAARGCVPHPGMPMLAGQVDLILEFLGLSGQQPGLVPHLSAFARAVRTSRPRRPAALMFSPRPARPPPWANRHDGHRGGCVASVRLTGEAGEARVPAGTGRRPAAARSRVLAGLSAGVRGLYPQVA